MSKTEYYNEDIRDFLEKCKKAPALVPEGPNQAFKSEKLNGQRPDPISETKPKLSESLWGGDFLEVPNECAIAEVVVVNGEPVSNEDPQWHHISVVREGAEHISSDITIDEQEYDIVDFPVNASDLDDDF